MKTKGNWKRLEVVISIRHSKNRDDDDEGGRGGGGFWTSLVVENRSFHFNGTWATMQVPHNTDESAMDECY